MKSRYLNELFRMLKCSFMVFFVTCPQIRGMPKSEGEIRRPGAEESSNNGSKKARTLAPSVGVGATSMSSSGTSADIGSNVANALVAKSGEMSRTFDLFVMTKDGKPLDKAARQELLLGMNTACIPLMTFNRPLPKAPKWAYWRKGKTGPKHTVLRCETDVDRERVRSLIRNDKYTTKLKSEMPDSYNIRLTAHVGGPEMTEGFYKIALTHSFQENKIEGDWTFAGYSNKVVRVACDEKFLESLETKAGMQVQLALLGNVRFNRLEGKTTAGQSEAWQREKARLLQVIQDAKKRIRDIERKEEVGATCSTETYDKMDVEFGEYLEADSDDDNEGK